VSSPLEGKSQERENVLVAGLSLLAIVVIDPDHTLYCFVFCFCLFVCFLQDHETDKHLSHRNSSYMAVLAPFSACCSSVISITPTAGQQ